LPIEESRDTHLLMQQKVFFEKQLEIIAFERGYFEKSRGQTRIFPRIF